MTLPCRNRVLTPNALLFVLLALTFAIPCDAASGSTETVSYGQRTDAFRRLLFEIGFQPLHDFADLQINPNEKLLIVLGDPRCLSKRRFPQGLRAFVEGGGAVLIATDNKTGGEAGKNLSDLARVTVTGELLACPSPNAADLYDGSPYCPFVQPIAEPKVLKGSTNILGALAAVVGVGSKPALFRNPLPEKGDLHVAANAPSYLKVHGRLLPFGIHLLARLPADCMVPNAIFFDGSFFNARLPDSDEPFFAVGGSVGKGRVLVLADHSLFINRMILARDNGNLEFAANCLHWLRGGVSTPAEALRAVNGPEGMKQLAGQRNKVLFWDDGVLRTDFEVPLKRVARRTSLGSEPALVAAIDRTITRMEENDVFNNKLIDALDLDVPWGRQRVLRGVVWVLTLMAAMLLAYRFLWRSRYRAASAVPLLAEAVRRQEPKSSLLEQRRRSVLRSGNVWETAHRLARESFESAGVPLTAATPRITMTQGGAWQRWRLRRRLRRLWRLARGDAPFPISPPALKRWLRELEELKRALKDGTIRLT